MADDENDAQRTIAACDECGSLYAALEITADEFRPIGRRDGCECGSTAFSPVESEDTELSIDGLEE
ncbi:hypothetical protein [Natronolimnohabitans innermongolicus]|uniref:Uncharacterized protein n=1 Tax=Natronolimnohabitans innermongolicus JCM 12255 TaxID=1227499 RepID=L9WW68_9EURY|nr:hypothetical protein [Natronolimnohabitans innermongolicus]ELY52578.1 hypothetical protein C493_16055 [Natronolimnohabitans innermongolicus JCM 12255]